MKLIKQEALDKIEELKKYIDEEDSPKATPSEEVAVCSYKFLCDCDFKKKILIKDEPEKMIFVNQSFADRSVFGDSCVFINCEFGSYCEFGSDCEFSSSCKFGSYCKFGSGCEKQLPYWDENGKHE